MSTVESGSGGAGLVGRVKDILLRPTETWRTIEAEPATIGGLYRGWVIPLAAIPPICAFLGLLIFGIGGFGVTIRPSPVWLFAQMVVSYGLALAMCYIMALVIEALAPNFGGTKDRTQAFKVAAYASTASWIAGVFSLLPALAIIGLLGGLYSLFLLYRGLPIVMKTPEEKALPYTALVIVIAIVISLVIGVISASVMTFSGAMTPAALGRASGTVNTPAGSIDLARLEEASKRAEAAAARIESGQGVAATDPDALKAFLPQGVAGFTRTELSASGGGAMGIEGSAAEATYAKGDSNLRLEVTDLGAAGALAGMASAFDVKSSTETATGYEKVGRVGGRMTQESYDREARSGEYGVLVGERFMVQARGDGVTMDELKAAVGAVDVGRLERLARAE